MSDVPRVDWLNWVKAINVTFRKGYVELPAFSYENQPWAGASDIVAQYNYTAARNFYVVTPPTKPVGVNFGLTIRYRVGNDRFRYKLWADDNFDSASLDCGVYNSEIIGKNFVIEVWSLEGEETSSMDEALQILSSIRAYPDDVRDMSEYSIGEGDEITLAELVLPLTTVEFPEGDCSQRLVAQDLTLGVATDWEDRIQGSQWTVNGAPIVAVDADKINGLQYVTLDGIADFFLASAIVADIGLNSTIYMVVEQVSWSLTEILFASRLNSGGTSSIVDQALTTPGLRFERGADVTVQVDEATIGSFKLVRIRRRTPNVAGIQTNDNPEKTKNLGSAANLGGTFCLGATISGLTPANFRVAELAIFAKDTTVDGSDDAIKAYFYQTYGLEQVILQESSTANNVNSAWLDNEL